ncbi:MAG: energy-coupling factor transporter transmembrane component T [Eubacteriales bacterium]|nr:energy-coupling factor transporter transmembrane component T [Eubacteriales bacterium]
MRGFQGYHPAILFLYYALLLLLSLLTMQPVLLLCSLFGAFLLYAALFGIREMLPDLVFYALLFVLLAVINPLVVHDGETVLFFLNGKAITKEAIAYGGAGSLVMITVVVWSACYTELLTTDKILFLFGKALPKLGLILSMTFRFIPLFQKQADRIGQVQRTMGLYNGKNLKQRFGGAYRTFDSLLTWSMENSIDTADAMKARGYGLRGRSSFSVFRFRLRDGKMLALMLLLSGIVLIGAGKGNMDFYFYPHLAEIETGAEAFVYYLAMLLLCCIPGFCEWKESLSWNYLKSKI